MILARVICLLINAFTEGIGWMISPAETSSSFGFIFDDLSLAAQNALIRDLTAFFLIVPILCLLSSITANHRWIFAVAILFGLVVLAHIVAATIHETGFIMEMFLPEIVILILSIAGTYLMAKQQNKT